MVFQNAPGKDARVRTARPARADGPRALPSRNAAGHRYSVGVVVKQPVEGVVVQKQLGLRAAHIAGGLRVMLGSIGTATKPDDDEALS